MRIGIVASVLVFSPLLASCQGVMFGNLAVLAITVGIFLGTLSLGRHG
jgi:hypothetical protein